MTRVLLVFAIGLLFLAPLLALLPQVDLAQVQEIAAAPSFPKAVGITALTGSCGALLSVLLGLVLAWPFALYDWRFKRAQRLALLVPYLVPNFILATAYVVSWNPATGLLNGAWEFPFGLYGVFGMTALFGIAHFPVAFLMLEDKIRRLDGSLREAARLSGASPWVVLARVELPLIRPTILAAFGLCFALDISAFAIPAWIGAPERAYPLTYKIYQAMQVGGADGIPQAAAYSVVLVMMTIPILVLTALAQRHERRYAVVSGKSARTGNRRPALGWFVPFQAAVAILAGGLVLAPMVALFATTITAPGCLQQQGLACFQQVTARSYRYVLFDLAETHQAFFGSGVYGTLAAALVTLLSVVTIGALAKTKALQRVVEWTFTLLMAAPGAVIALGLIVACTGKYGINLYNTPWIVVLAFVLKHQNLAYQPLRTGITNLSPSLGEAARLSGATATATWRKIILPILRPELVGGFFLALVPILGELTMSIFLASPRFRSLGTVLFDLQDYADQASAGALAIILMVLIFAANEAGRIFSRGRVGY